MSSARRGAHAPAYAEKQKDQSFHSEAFPEKEEMDKTEEALRGFFDLRMEKEDTTEKIIQKHMTVTSKCTKQKMIFPEEAQGFSLLRATTLLQPEQLDSKNQVMSLTHGEFKIKPVRKALKILYKDKAPY